MTGVIGVSERPVSKPEAGQLGLEPARVRPQAFLELGFVLHHPDRLAARGHDGRRMRGGEQERTGSLGQDLAKGDRTGDVAPERADGLAERADLDRHAAVQPEMVDRSAAVPAEHARGVGVVDHHGRAERFGGLDDPGERRDVAVHREDPIGHHEDQVVFTAARPPLRPCLAEDLAEGSDVGMRIDLPRAPWTGASRR